MTEENTVNENEVVEQEVEPTPEVEEIAEEAQPEEVGATEESEE